MMLQLKIRCHYAARVCVGTLFCASTRSQGPIIIVSFTSQSSKPPHENCSRFMYNISVSFPGISTTFSGASSTTFHDIVLDF